MMNIVLVVLHFINHTKIYAIKVWKDISTYLNSFV